MFSWGSSSFNVDIIKNQKKISENLPFVTAGETDEGVSDFIGNEVRIFLKNTTTIDIFGSAKYRNYEYGGDDYVAIVHTEKLPMKAAIFDTTAIHKLVMEEVALYVDRKIKITRKVVSNNK